MPTLMETEASLSYVHCFLYLVSSSLNVSICHSTWLHTFWTDLVYIINGFQISFCYFKSLRLRKVELKIERIKSPGQVAQVVRASS